MQIGTTASQLSVGLDEYKETGVKHNEAGIVLGGIFDSASKLFKGDEMLEEPFSKVDYSFLFWLMKRYKRKYVMVTQNR